MARWTRAVIRHRKKILLGWLIALVLGGTASAGLADLLTNRFSIPGSESQKGSDLIENTMHDQGQGAFTLVAQATRGSSIDPAFVRSVEAAGQRAAAVVKEAKAGPVIQAKDNVAYVQISTPLEFADASDKTPAMRKAIAHPAGIRTYHSGGPAIDSFSEVWASETSA